MQEGRKGLEQFFFSDFFSGILFSVFFFISLIVLKWCCELCFLVFFSFESPGKLRKALIFCVVARGGWNHKYGDILESILASFAQFYSGKNMV